MADRWLFSGGGLDSLRAVAGAPAAVTTGGTFDSSYADHAVNVTTTATAAADFTDSTGAGDTVITGEKLFAHFTGKGGVTNVTAAAALLEVQDASNYPWLAIRGTGTANTYGLYYNSGTGPSPTWTLLGSTFTINGNGGSVETIDLWVTLGSPHSVGIAKAGSLLFETTFTQASFTSANKLYLRSPTSSFNFSEISATVGINTVGSHVFYGKPTGAGASSAWSGTTGTFADIDDAGINDTDALTSGTAAQRSTFAYSNVPTLGANEALGDVFLWTRARNSGGAPSNVKPVRRTSGGTDNVGSNLSGISGAYANYLTRYSALSESEFNGSEFGVESAT